MAEPTPEPSAPTMRAWILHPNGDLTQEDRPVPQVGPSDALVRTSLAMLCRGDVERRPGRPKILGHEATGVVERVGSDVKYMLPGQRVVVSSLAPCYRCRPCLVGVPSCCEDPGPSDRSGALAEFMLVNQADSNLAPIPYTVDDERAVYCSEALALGAAAAEMAATPIGGTVAVFGQGAIGLLATASARMRGAGLVLAVEKNPDRRKMSLRLGADHVIDFERADPVDAILRLTGADGVDAAIDTLSNPVTLESCRRVSRPGGIVVQLGEHPHPEVGPQAQAPWPNGSKASDLRQVFCPAGSEPMRRLLRLLESRRLDPGLLTTHQFAFDQVDRAYAMLRDRQEGIIKPAIHFPR